MKNQYTFWYEVVNLIRTIYPYKVSRRMLLWLLDLKSGYSVKLTDNYRLILTRAGYLKHIGRGLYKVQRKPPLNLTYAKAKEMAYGKR